MNERNDKLSALMDGELGGSDKCLERLAQDAEMREIWQRYHVARDAIQGRLSENPLLDISQRVSHELENEAIIFTPLWRRIKPRYFMKQVAGLAVAAAVATVAVVSVQQNRISQDDITGSIAKAGTEQIAPQAITQSPQIRQVAFTTRKNLDISVESKLSGYLVNHNEYTKTLRVSGVMPYSRIVSYVSSASSEQSNNDK